MAEPIIQLKNVTKRFGAGEEEVAALEDISIAVQPGEIFGVIGLSGAGKSTLVRCINLLERPTSGSVIVDGQDMTALSGVQLRRARKSIGMIFQGFNLLMQRTALDNICFPMEIAKTPRKEAVDRAKELLEIVDLSSRANAYPAQLSGGQKQRVAIARSMANDPAIILADEPTGALDSKTGRMVMDLFHQLNREQGKTIVLITHNQELALETDRFVTMRDGRLYVGDTGEEVRYGA